VPPSLVGVNPSSNYHLEKYLFFLGLTVEVKEAHQILRVVKIHFVLKFSFQIFGSTKFWRLSVDLADSNMIQKIN